MIELEDGGKDLVVKILDLLLLSYQLLKFKVRDLEEKSSRDLVVHFIFYSVYPYSYCLPIVYPQ